MQIKRLSPAEEQQVEQLREEMLIKFSTLPGDTEVLYEEKSFQVQKNVFWPGEDSKALVRNFRIEPGEQVLDVGTGTGVLSIFAAYKGAGKVVALELNPDAVASAQVNIAAHDFSSLIEVRQSDMFQALKDNEKFDVIVSNPPMTCRKANSLLEASFFDEDLKFQDSLFGHIHLYLKEHGRIYLTQSNFGAIDSLLDKATLAGYEVKPIGENTLPGDPRVFYAFELQKV